MGCILKDRLLDADLGPRNGSIARSLKGFGRPDQLLGTTDLACSCFKKLRHTSPSRSFPEIITNCSVKVLKQATNLKSPSHLGAHHEIGTPLRLLKFGGNHVRAPGCRHRLPKAQNRRSTASGSVPQ